MKRKPSRGRNGNRYGDLTDVSQAKDRPPVAPARVAVLKANYKQAWLYFLLIVSLLIAWGVPLRYFIGRQMAFRRADMGPRDATEFVAIAYEAISAGSDNVTPDQFQDHVSALREAGYTAITLSDIHTFYTEGKKLPRRAVLVTFDHSTKSAYFEARSVLARIGWPGVVFLWTLPIETHDPAGLRWPYVRAMYRSGAWEIGAQSHHGFRRIQADSEGTLRNYMTAPRWLTERMQYETPEAFAERIEADHHHALGLISTETGARPRAFAFPYGDFGQYDARAALSRQINLDLVGELYDLGFIHGSAALNTRYSDPRRLHRLLVDPDWSGEELVARLESAWPRREGIDSVQALSSPLMWLREWGEKELSDGTLSLRALPDTTGATVWMSGSDLFGDIQARFQLRIQEGQVGLYFRSSPDRERYVYLGLGADGEIWLRQKHVGLPPFTLGSAYYTADETGTIELEVYLRGPYFVAAIDGRSVFQEIMTLRGEVYPGMLGLGVWDPRVGAADAAFSSVSAEPFRQSVLTWTPSRTQLTELAYWMSQHAVRHSHLATPWLKVASRAHSEQPGWDEELFRGFAAAYNMSWTPEIIFEGLWGQEEGLPEHLAGLATELGADGLYCNLSELREPRSLSRATTWIQEFSAALEKKDLDLIVRLPPEWVRETTLSSLLNNLPHIQVAVEGIHESALPVNEGAVRSSHRLLHTESIALEPGTAPPVHRLSGLDAEVEDWTDESRSKLLRREGFDAFTAGRFDRALEMWSHWAELEPRNPEPPRLLGDLHLRRNAHGEAIDSYRVSLERNPGQIRLVTQTARLLVQEAGAPEEAETLLNLYARLFPNEPDILLTQAELLLRQGRREEAGVLVRQVIAENPDDLTALALLHALLDAPKARIRNIEAILEIAGRPGVANHFAQVIRDHNLLIWPESWALMDFVEERAAEERDSDEPGPYSKLIPRKTIAREAFSVRRLSDNWIEDSDAEEIPGEPFLLAAGPASSEATLILAHSEAMHSGFIEAQIGESRGDFWLYARRAKDSRIRFGFEHGGRMFLQVWHRGQLITNQSREWRAADVNRLRLEVRGNAAFGYIDGEPAFGAPVRIPVDMGLGWWGISPWAPDYGVAQVVLREVAGGPLPVTLAAFGRRDNGWTDPEITAALQPYARHLQLVAPAWFVQEADGRIRSDDRGEEYANLRLLTRFYQIRLLPAIRGASPRTLDIEELVALAAEEGVSGFTLLFVRMPDEEWFQETQDALMGTGVSLVAMRVREDDAVDIREMSPHVGLFAGRRSIRTLPQVDMSADATDMHLLDPVEIDADTESGEEITPPPSRVLYF